MVSWVAVAWALAAPLVAVAVRGQGLVAPPPPSRVSPQDAAAQARRSIVFFAVLESGAIARPGRGDRQPALVAARGRPRSRWR